MSKAENMVKWCLNKAKAEMEKGELHRGLVKIKPDDKMALEYIGKAEHNLEAFLYNKEGGFYDWTISIGFYVIYHCCLAVITKFGFESRNQECTFALINNLIEDEKIGIKREWMNKIALFDTGPDETTGVRLREKFQYGTQLSLDDNLYQELVDLAKKILSSTKVVLEK